MAPTSMEAPSSSKPQEMLLHISTRCRKRITSAHSIVSPSGNVDHCPAMTTKQLGAVDDLRSPTGMPGGFLFISANKGQDGIVWASVTCFKDRLGKTCDDASTTSGETTGRLLAFDALTLKLLWKDPTNDGPNAPPFANSSPRLWPQGMCFA
jgi:hypothetical protein